jgi:hypothetical protein
MTHKTSPSRQRLLDLAQKLEDRDSLTPKERAFLVTALLAISLGVDANEALWLKDDAPLSNEASEPDMAASSASSATACDLCRH